MAVGTSGPGDVKIEVSRSFLLNSSVMSHCPAHPTEKRARREVDLNSTGSLGNPRVQPTLPVSKGRTVLPINIPELEFRTFYRMLMAAPLFKGSPRPALI